MRAPEVRRKGGAAAHSAAIARGHQGGIIGAVSWGAMAGRLAAEGRSSCAGGVKPSRGAYELDVVVRPSKPPLPSAAAEGN